MAHALGALAIVASAGEAQQYQPPTVRAVRIAPDEPGIRVDGLLDEAIWQRAPAAGGFKQREPSSGADASETTEILVAYDGGTLYIGVRAYDSEPEATIARILQRDRIMELEPFGTAPQFTSDDAVAILLDPFHDHRNAVIFGTNPNGAEFDALLTDEGREFNVDWRGIWSVAAQRGADGWSAEFAIPFRSLRYPGGGGEQRWGLNVYRVIRRKNEEVLWSSWSRENEGFHRVSRAGHLEGLVDLPRSGLNVEIKPYLLGGATQERNGPDVRTELRPEPGLDAKSEIVPGMLLDLTVNTDFAQVEADDEQVNLTRFDLFFPEKREFFLENAGVFEYGLRSPFEPPPFLLFFSRTIGIDPDSGEVPVLGGARLSGRVGRQTVGLLNVVTDAAYGTPVTNYAVARIKRDVGGANYVGGMVTDRRSQDGWNSTGGADFSFWPTRAVNLQGFAARTATSGAGGEGSAYRVGADYSGDRFGLNVAHLYVGPDAVADMGFITRTDIRRSDVLGRFTPRPRVLGLRKIDVFALGQVVTRVDGGIQDWQVGPAIGPEWNSGESVNVFLLRGFTRLDEGFSLREDDDPAEDVFVPAGEYDVVQTGAFVNSSRNRFAHVSASAFLQWTYGGRVHSLSGTLTVSPSANLSTGFTYAHNIVDVPGGAFTADIASLRVGVAASTKLSANVLLQYNSLDNEISANVRLNLIHGPGSDLFLVYNELRGSERSPWDFGERTGIVKVTYLARL